MENLLARDTDVNGTNQGGQTALMLAALLGHTDVVRLLLTSGADAQVRDGLGLTALDWAHRRGFAKVVELLAAPPPTRTTSPEPIVASTSARPSGADPKPPWPAAEAAPTLSKSAPAAQSAAGTRRVELAAETRVQSAPPEAGGQGRERVEPDVLQPTAEESARIRVRVEEERILEEARQRVEEGVRRKSLTTTPGGGQKATVSHLRARATTREPVKSLTPLPVMRCPKCNTIFETEVLEFCGYDGARLINLDSPSPRVAPGRSYARPAVWVLLGLAFVASLILVYRIGAYFLRTGSGSAPIGQAPERKVLAIVGGGLAGMELAIPVAEYPIEAEEAGVSGTVTVVVRVDEQGNVLDSRAMNGPLVLQTAAVDAANKATFVAEKLAGRKSGVSGTITYVFKL